MAHPKSLIERFLTEFISSEDLIFDSLDENGRAGVAVLLDKVNNPANDACLEIIGLRSDVNQAELISNFISLSLARTPTAKNGVQLALPQGFPLDSLSNSQQLDHYYDVYNMERSELASVKEETFPQVVAAQSSDSQSIYQVLCRSFEKNPDTSIPDFKSWTRGFLGSPRSHFFAWREGNQIIGFTNLIQDEDTNAVEIRTIGVLPDFQGRGIGHKLLKFSLRKSHELGCTRCHLSVALTNQKALKLYQSVGFKVVEKSSCYRVALRK